MINQQENAGLSDSHHRHECEVYDDLSALMKIFKKLLLIVEEISLLHPKPPSQHPPQQRLRGLAKALDGLVRKYSDQSGQLRIEQRTFQRFVCRLFETLEICQLKFHSHEGSLTASRLAVIENALKEGDCLHDFLRLIRTIKIVVEKTASLEQLGSGLDASAQESPQARKITLDRMEAKMIKLRNVHRARVERRQERGQSDQEDEYDEVRSVSFTEKKATALPISQSISSDLQRRFELYKGLDLDFSNFKNSYFSAKSNTELFYREYLERNFLSSRFIKEYCDDFLLFQKKRFKNHRRIALNKQNQQNVQEYDLTPKINHSQHLTKSEHLTRKMEKEKGRVAVIHSEEGQEEKDDRLKTSYKMNSIYLTFGKKTHRAAQKHPNITPNMLRNRLEPHTPFHNHSQCPKNDLSLTQSIDFDQLKVVSGLKGAQRMRTQPDRAAQEQAQKARGEYRDAMMRAFREAEQLPIRTVSKRRYLQLDCTSKKEISLNKVILTGNLHARHIKLGKLQGKDSAILF